MYFTIGEVEKIIRVKAYTIQYDIEKILKIKDLLYEEGMTIDGVNKYFRKKGNRHIDKKPDKAFEHTILEYVVNELKNILESFD
jgi:DNA-binding transcriptional MerR regulator